eukprot:CAMPEP_0169195756 /NCGR_PEP_ID=MMETSP1016-20121227/7379_1 /TAXON_ID=342587 /ORGANISM="Karlodinium micrum, Strain CCMP2283" /LENGTH=452 /DNA_ID=CAMNT_0009272307 /DNA_START=114 /DNA_END=1468 /DNA_ORIENTATION=+
MDVSDLTKAEFDGKQGSARLWEIYDKMIVKLEGERCFISAEIENLLVPVEDRHRVEWERKQRIAEIEDLSAQLQQVEQQLLNRQEELVQVAGENDRLRAQSSQWNEELERARAIMRPRVDAVHYSPGLQPEKIGRFVPALPNKATSKESSGPVLVEYLPCDRQEVTDEHFLELRRRLADEQQGHKIASETIQNLKLIEEEEHGLCLTALKQQLDRIKKHRCHIRERTDEVLQCHTRLKAENEGLRVRGSLEIQQLLDFNALLSKRLEVVVSQGTQEVSRAESQWGQMKCKADSAYLSGVMRAREDTGILHEQIDERQASNMRSIEGFERQLSALKKRYDAISNHRTTEVDALRVDIEGLRRAVRMCEKHAMQCLSSGFHRGGVAIGMDELHDKRSSVTPASSQKKNCPSAALDAVALRPLVAKLRTIMERCEASLKEEESQLAASRHPDRSA